MNAVEPKETKVKLNSFKKISADHFNAYNEARKLMSEKGIQSLPVDPFELAKKMRVDVIPYSEAEEIFPEKIPKLRSKKIDAIVAKSDYSDEDYYILYDDSMPFERVRFTIAHEIGHIRIGHMSQLDNQLTRYGYNKITDPIEQEAESFAGELLRPPLLLSLLNIENPSEIQTICCVSFTAASVGSRSIKKLKPKSSDSHKKLVEFYKKQFHNFIHQKRCLHCHHTFIHPNANYCPICGTSSIKWGNVRSSIYEFVQEVINVNYFSRELDRNSKAIVCPKCENESIDPEGTFCQICGTYLINECWGEFTYNDIGDDYFNKGCGQPAEGDARHCTKCGAQTTFCRDELLPNWQEEFNVVKNEEGRTA